MLPFGHSGLSVGALEELEQYTIVMWYGLIANIPAGWVICDGTLGTPDMRSRFPRGAEAGAEAAGGGGADSHSHDVDIPSGTVTRLTGGLNTASSTHINQTDSRDNIPVFKRVIFIMKT